MKFTKLLMILVLSLIGLQANAQNVTIKATNGSMIASVPYGSYTDPFYASGGFATWQHEQLSMVLTTSDMTNLTDNGQLANPANNLYSDGAHIQIAKGQDDYRVCYVSLSLPKGYRFTKYTIVFSKPNELTKTLESSTTFNSSTRASRFGETNSSFQYLSSAYYKDVVRGGNAQTITRTADDMTNVLYFRFQNTNANVRELITLVSAEFEFTAEEDYTPILPEKNILNPVSAVDIPFATSKVDYGPITSRPYGSGSNAAERISYSSANVTDLMANMTLYEAESITDENITHFDGITGKGVKYEEGASHTIRTEGDYFRGGRPAAEGQTEPTEQIYYIESPTYVTLSNEHKNPVGYRIVGAKIDYSYGANMGHGPIAIPNQTETVHHSETHDVFYISGSVELFSRSWTGGPLSGHYVYTSQGVKTYYLTSSAGMSQTEGEKALWFMDDDGYIRLVSDPTKYLKNGNNNNGMTLVSSTGSPAKFEIIDGQIKLVTNNNSNMYLCLSVSLYNNQYPYQVNSFSTINNGTYKATRTSQGSQTIQWDTEEQAYYPNSAFEPGEFTIRLYDKSGKRVVKEQKVTSTTKDGSLEWNDFNNDAVMIGIKGVGLFRGHLTMQALDPYLDMMKVVCTDPAVEPDLRTTQDFTASDFSVNGGKFYFYLPSECKNHEVAITFEDLKSKYFDETYTGGSTNHKSRINFVKSLHYNSFGATANNVYTDTLEAAQARKERLKVGVVGTTKFKFNNAAEVGTNGGTFTEYPFTLENYTGSFSDMKFTVKDEDQELTRYVFTTDETRYNIAPTTALQHRAYAFYEMEVHVQSSTYSPEVKFVKVYDNTDYDNSAETGGSIDQDDAFYGAIVTVDNHGKPGYASTDAIFNAINDSIAKANGTNAPKTSKQLLYLDFSQLEGIMQTTTEQHQSMEDYSATNAANCMIFLPVGASAPNNNVAYKTQSGTFEAANDIVLTDKQPFFSPYDIYVRSTNYATYTRKITRPENGKVRNATLMLPFGLSIDENGRHTNDDGECVFTINELKGGKALALEDGSNVNYGVGYFDPITPNEEGRSEANVPYIVKVESFDSGEASFVASQKGAMIAKTPNANFVKTLGQVTMTSGHKLTHEATYSGKMYKRSDSENVFYFANDKFFDLHNLVAHKPILYMYPFRSVYTYTGGSTVNILSWLEISYDDEDLTDGIRPMPTNADLMVRSGNGTLQIEAQRGQTVTVRSLDGLMVTSVSLNAGDSKIINLPSGVYVVNNVKIIVK